MFNHTFFAQNHHVGAQIDGMEYVSGGWSKFKDVASETKIDTSLEKVSAES